MKNREIPEAFPPSEYIREEATERGWTPSDLADILGLSRAEISNILNGRTAISTKIAKVLDEAFGTGAQVWLNLQAAYDLAMSKAMKDDSIARRSKLYEKVPVRELQKRGWIEETKNVDVLESQVCSFLNISSLEEELQIEHAPRKSTNYGENPNSAQLAWLMRATHLAEAIHLEDPYSGRRFNTMIRELKPLLFEPDAVAEIPKIMNQYGIRFIVLEHLPKTKIDGACFWLDKNSPVVVLSLRYDRIDNFWHSLMHELKHVQNRDGESKAIIEIEMVGERTEPIHDKPAEEHEADSFAVNTLVDQEKLQDFIMRKGEMFSKRDINGFARSLGVHPGIIVGQLHYLDVIEYSHFRATLVKVRNNITASAFTDGWGYTVGI